MLSRTQVHFVRHGHVHNPEEVFYGRLPGFGLSEQGRNQAQSAAAALHDNPLAAVFSSPMQRAQETAAHIVALHKGLAVLTSELINETKAPYEGQPLSEMAKRGWDIYSGNTLPFEQPQDLLRRMLEFVAQIRANYAGQQVVAVTHGDPLAFVLLWAKGGSITGPARLPLYRDFLAKGSITTFSFGPASEDQPEVRYCLPYPPGEQAPSGIAKWLAEEQIENRAKTEVRRVGQKPTFAVR